MGDGWQAVQPVGRPRGVTRPRGYVFSESRISVVVSPPWITGRDRETVWVMIVTIGWGVATTERCVHQFRPINFISKYLRD